MTKPYLRDLRADAVELLKARGQWIVAGVKTNIPWPKETQIVPFEGIDFILRPLTEEQSRTVCLNVAKLGVTLNEGRDLIMKLGSALAFSEGNGFEVTMWTGGSFPIFIGRQEGHVVQEYLEPEYLPTIPDDDAATALALYREGTSSDSNFYAFLNLYKVISFIHRDGKKRGEWIEETLPTLTHDQAKARLEELQKDNINPSEYLRDFGRHAIAHAEKDFFVNPDKLVDHERIYRDLPIMRALARVAIEQRFQIFPRISRDAPEKSDVPGFERIFGIDLTQRLLSTEDVENASLNVPDDITALVRFRHQIISFTGLAIADIKRWEDGAAFRLVNANDTMYLAIAIDFRKRELVYEPDGNCGTKLNKSSRASIQQHIKLKEFNWLYYGNGRLELWDTETDELLGMTTAYIPFNRYLDSGLINKARSDFQTMLDEATED